MAAFNDLQFKNWTASDKANSLTARLWNGAIRFSVYPKERLPGAPNKPLLSIALDQGNHAYLGLLQMIDQLQKSPLGTKIPMSKTQWNPATKQSTNQWVITLEKDSEMCYWITLTECASNATYRFPISASRSIVIGSEPPNKSGQSAMGMSLFKMWLQQAHDYAPATAEKPGQFGKGGAPRPQMAAPAAPAAAAPSGDASDDMPF